MSTTHRTGRAVLRSIAAASLIAGALSLTAGVAHAGECPADKVGVNVTEPGPSEPKEVKDTVIGSIDLASYGEGLAGRKLRTRMLEIQPGGIVPWHSHEQRPAIIYVLEGAILEYSGNCAVPIEHKAGEVSVETTEVQHWWKNEGDTVVKLLSSDVLPDQMAANMQ